MHLGFVICQLVWKNCGDLFQTAKIHLTRHMDGKLYIFILCGKSFSWAEAFRTHICPPLLSGGLRFWAGAFGFERRPLVLGGAPMPSEGLRPGPRGRHCWETHLLNFVIFHEQDSLIQMQMVYTILILLTGPLTSVYLFGFFNCPQIGFNLSIQNKEDLSVCVMFVSWY